MTTDGEVLKPTATMWSATALLLFHVAGKFALMGPTVLVECHAETRIALTAQLGRADTNNAGVFG